jgi:hypothetical protein
MKKLIISIFLLVLPFIVLSQQVYKSELNGFEITVPDDWKLEKNNKPGIEVSATKEKTASMGIVVQQNSIYDGKTLDDFGLESMKEIVINEFKNKYKNFNLSDYGNTEINDNKAYYFKYSFDKSEGLHVIAKQYMILKDGKLYVITVVCMETEYKSYERVLETITYSFKFIS